MSSSSVVLFICHLRANESVPAKVLPSEAQLSQYAVDADELPLPLSFSARLFSPSFSASVVSLLSAALCDSVIEHRSAAAASSTSLPAIRFILLGNNLCAAILPPPAQSLPPSTRHVPLVPAFSATQPAPSTSSAARPATGPSVLPPILSPSAYLSPPDTSQLSLPSPDPSDAVDMVDDGGVTATPISHSPQPLIMIHTKAALSQPHRCCARCHPQAALHYRRCHPTSANSCAIHRLASHIAHLTSNSLSVEAMSVLCSSSRTCSLTSALSVNTFPSLASLTPSTRRSLAIVNADDTTTSTVSVLSTPAYTLHSADSAQLLGPPPLSAIASSAVSPNTPSSMPALSPLVDDDGKLSPGCADNNVSTSHIDTVQQLPFSPWTLDTAQSADDMMDTDYGMGGPSPLSAHFVRFIKQQTLAPLSPAFLLSTTSASACSTARPSPHWKTVQHWLGGCSLLTRAFSHCRPAPLMAKQLSLPAFEQSKPPLSLHCSSARPASALPLVSLPPPRLVFGFESELRDVPAAAVSLYTQSNFRPALTAKDAVYAIAMPSNHTAAEEKRVDVWFDAFSAAYENGGLGRHRPLSGHGRSGVLKLRSIYEVLKERGEASVSIPVTPASPADSGTASNAASPRAGSSSMILLSSEEPTGSRATLPLSRSLALHNSAAPDGMRRYYQSIVAALIAELDGISKGQGAEQLDRFDALILYIVVDDKLPVPHDVQHMSDYLSCLYFDRHSDSSFAGALSQLEQMDVVIRLLPSSALSLFSSPSFTHLSLSVYSSVRRMLDRLDSDSDVELPKHVEQLYEPVTYIAGKRMEGKDDGMAETAGGTCTLVCVWTVYDGRLLACTCDERGQVMDSLLCESTGTATSDVRQCWAQCVQTVWTMARRHRQVQQCHVLLVEWTDESTATSTSANYEREWSRMLAELRYAPTVPADRSVLLSQMTDTTNNKGSSFNQPAYVTQCSVSWDAAFSVLALHDATPTSASTIPASSASASATRQPLVVEGINSASTLASHCLFLPPPTLCSSAQHRVPLASMLMFLHRTTDATRSTLARPVPSPLPGHTGAPLLLSLHDHLGLTTSANGIEKSASLATSTTTLLATVAEQLQQLSFVNIAPLLSVGEVDGGTDGDVSSGTVPLPVCIVQRLTRLLSSCRASA